MKTEDSKIESSENAPHSCACIGPQNGEIYCPCMMKFYGNQPKIYTESQHQQALDEQRELAVKWAMSQGFVTGHASTLKDLLDEAGLQVTELRESKNKAVISALDDVRVAMRSNHINGICIDTIESDNTRKG